METKTKTFDAVAESRKWREAASQKLNAMSRAERLAYLKGLGERVRAEMRSRQIAKPAEELELPDLDQSRMTPSRDQKERNSRIDPFHCRCLACMENPFNHLHQTTTPHERRRQRTIHALPRSG